MPIDKNRLRGHFDRAADSYDEAAVLQHEVARRLHERLALCRIAPQRILDIGAGTGRGTAALLKSYRGAQVIALDLSLAMLAKTRCRGSWLRRPSLLCADAERLPVADGSIDLLHSNLTLQWCNDLDRVFGGFRRAMGTGGLLMFTTFGPDTLKELRACWGRVDGRPHVNTFVDMHDIGDALVRAGFADPVMDMEVLTLTYREPRELMRDLKRIGATNAMRAGPSGLMSPTRLLAVERAYEDFRREDGLLPATYEVVYGHAWVPNAPPPSRIDPNSTIPINPR